MSTRRYISWDEVHRAAHELAMKLNPNDYAGLLVLTRGGLAPAQVFAQAHNFKYIDTMCIESYRADPTGLESEQSTLKVYKGPSAEFIAHVGDRRCLVVDEVCDTGKTVIYVRKALSWLGLQHTIVTPYVKPLGKPHVDAYYQEVPQDTWIDFPWEQPPKRFVEES